MLTAFIRRVWHSPTATTWGSLAVRLSVVVLVLPVVLVRFAPADVALWQLFSSLFMLAMMLDFGLAPTFARLLAFARGGASVSDMARVELTAPKLAREHDPAAAPSVMSALRWLYPRLAVAATLLLAVLGTLGLVKPVQQSANPEAAWLAWGLVLATTGVAMWGGAYGAALQGMNKIALMRRWEVATGIGQIVTSMIVLLLGGHLLALVAGYQVWAVVGALRNRWLLRSEHPELFAQAPSPHPEVMRVMWPPAWRSGLGVLMGQGISQASGLIYSQMAPAAEVAPYLLALRLIIMISQFCQAPFYSKLPRMAELQAAGRPEEQLRLAQRGMRLAYWVFVAGAVFVALSVQPLLHLIGSRTAFVTSEVWALLSLAFFAERFGAMHLQLYSLTNHIVWHIANGVTGVLMILIAALTHRRWGEFAFPLAMFLSYACFYCPYSAAHARSAFKLRLVSFESRTALPALVALCAGLAVASMVPLHL